MWSAPLCTVLMDLSLIHTDAANAADSSGDEDRGRIARNKRSRIIARTASSVDGEIDGRLRAGAVEVSAEEDVVLAAARDESVGCT